MSIEAMKQALDFLEWFAGDDHSIRPKHKAPEIAVALRQAIAEAEMQEPEPGPITVEFREYLTRLNWQQGFERGWDEAVEKLTLTQEKLGYTAPVHASDMSEKHVHKSDKDTLIKQAEEAFESAKEKGWVGLTDEEIKVLSSWWPSYEQMPALMTLARDIENSLKEKNT